MIQTGRLQAEKNAGRWWVDSGQLPADEARSKTRERKQQNLRIAVDEALDLDPEPAQRYSVRDLKAFQIALPLYQQAETAFSAEHPAATYLKHVLEQLTQGCHRFQSNDKATAYRMARDQASLAVCELVLTGSNSADPIMRNIEQDLMPALAGLIRRVERRRRG